MYLFLSINFLNFFVNGKAIRPETSKSLIILYQSIHIISYVILPYSNSMTQNGHLNNLYAFPTLPYYEMTKCYHLLIINEQYINFKN